MLGSDRPVSLADDHRNRKFQLNATNSIVIIQFDEDIRYPFGSAISNCHSGVACSAFFAAGHVFQFPQATPYDSLACSQRHCMFQIAHKGLQTHVYTRRVHLEMDLHPQCRSVKSAFAAQRCFDASPAT